MRSIKLTSAVLAAAVLALATAGMAAARVHPHAKRHHGIRGGACHVTMNVAPHILTAGETALAYGQLGCKPAAEAGQTVTLFEHTVGTPGGFAAAGTAATDSHGFYQITTAALTGNSAFYVVADNAQSIERNVKVAAQVGLVGPEEGKQLSIATGRRNSVMFKGSVSPGNAGDEVVLQRQNSIRGNEWRRIGKGVVTAENTFAITHSFAVPGDSNIRVLVRRGRHNIASPSNVLTFEISQTQNPSLTIETATDPIQFGGSTVISGLAASEPNTVVTLMARGKGQPYVAVDSVKTDSTGAYTFPATSPQTSTFYEVRTADRKSAVLYQGVKYILTSAVDTATVQAGSPFTFSGLVTPAEAGHTVYLEKQNALGTGFHVSSTGSENAVGEYSIAHTVYTPGTYTFRIKVPGGPDHNGTAGTAVTITVTPRTPGPLTPEAPGNSGLPPEGSV
ncbi:MAG TPA: hypothetical protein VGG08_07310 [Solirubrobacteraceae bacterium]